MDQKIHTCIHNFWKEISMYKKEFLLKITTIECNINAAVYYVTIKYLYCSRPFRILQDDVIKCMCTSY